jgi:DNA-binding transcriptional LysR family regulator
MPALLQRLAAVAPRVSVAVSAQRDDFSDGLESGSLDAVLVPRRAASAGVVWRKLFSDRFVCVARVDNPRIDRRLTLERYCDLAHVSVSPQGRANTLIDESLAKLGRERFVALRVPSYLPAQLVVERSDLVLTVFERIAADPQLRIHPLPFAVPGITVSLAWHERVSRDPEHTWFRNLLTDVARQGARDDQRK